MKKNRARSETKKISPQPPHRLVNEMRGLVQATRLPRGNLRSLTPTQARVRINELFNEVQHGYSQNPKREISSRSVQRAQVSGRRTTNQPEVHGNRMPAPVRNLFQDAERALVCSSRKTRREVVFAMRRAGKAGARRNRKARWTSDSYKTCKGR